ncbi:hypothetical protein KR018_007212 [Drosophila ironensis]|nr:hypothetical protein KR018_007212 [Drosophila ironensis]
MKEWLKISCLLCVFGCVREIRPSEPYVTEFLLGPWRNITYDQLTNDVYPVGTYSYLVQLVFVFLITDFLRYKPLIITIGATGVIVYSMLIWTTSLISLQILEFFYGTYMAAEVAYYTYIYAKVEKKYYPRVTSHTRAAMFSGKLLSGIISQLMINLELMDYKQLNYITLATQIIAMLWAFSLPPVDKSLYFHRQPVAIKDPQTQLPGESNLEVADVARESNPQQIGALGLLWLHFRNAYTNSRVIQWSLWYAIGLAGYLQVTYYVQLLWKEIEPEPLIAWNGAVDAVLTALAALSALAAGFLHTARLNPRTSLLILALLSAVEGGCVLICCWTGDIYWSYVGFVLFGALYGFTITVASAEVARYLQEDSFGLVFGFNTFVALALQSLLTMIFVTDTGFKLSVVGQYTAYAFYFIGVGLLYLISVLVEYLWFPDPESEKLEDSLE